MFCMGRDLKEISLRRKVLVGVIFLPLPEPRSLDTYRSQNQHFLSTLRESHTQPPIPFVVTTIQPTKFSRPATLCK